MTTAISTIVDLLVIGGGINGTGVAADAAGRGLSVLLCEQNDLASATSSASSKLIHGGLRYLEHYEFRLVKESLAEREVLLRVAPHLVQPLRFTLPHRPHLRPAWMLRSGLFLYDHLSKRAILPSAHGVRFDASSPLKEDIKRGFEYSDCWVDDARLVVSNALAAHHHGAQILTRHRCLAARRDPSTHLWQVSLEDQRSGARRTVYAKALVNAAGPWINQVFSETLDLPSPRRIRLIKGSHIIVPRFHSYPGAFILQNTDQRIVFVLPYQDDFHLIGTTDEEYHGDPSQVSISPDEIQYLLTVVNDHFKAQLEASQIVSHYSGVRPLCDDESSDPSAITRDYTLELLHHQGSCPLLAIFGGKITTYRRLAEAALSRLQPYFPRMGSAWTAYHPLPGASTETPTQEAVRQRIQQAHPWLPSSLLERFSRSYGTLCLMFLQGITGEEELGQDFGHGLYQAEVDYLRTQEWAYEVDDILWRRTKLGLKFDAQQREKLERYLQGLPQVRQDRSARS